MVRAKFQVTKVSKCFYRNHEGKTIETGVEVFLSPQYDSSIEEDRRYAKATPSGEVRLFIDNPPASAYLEPGRDFYVDFTKCE
jgi:hypothetical protein